MQAIASRNPSWASYRTSKFLSEEGRPFPYVYLSTSQNATNSGKLRVWLQGSVHGNEPAGDEALLALVGALDADQEWAAGFLEALDIIVLPRYNPDGNDCEYHSLHITFA